MAKQLLLHQRPVTFPPRKPTFHLDLLTDNPLLDTFVGPQSWLLFDKLHADGQWLNIEPEEWGNMEEYK